jgi:short-subunit dehydrogenase
MQVKIDKRRFGPWALITGASSGIGREFARQIAASGIHVALVARRQALLEEAGKECSAKFGVEHRVIAADFSEEGFMTKLVSETRGLGIGLVVSNAGTGSPGRFLTQEREKLIQLLRLNTLAHLDLAHHFGPKLATRGSGGLLFAGAMGASNGIPFMANDAGAKAYVQSFALSLHDELKPLGVHVTVLPVPPTDTPVLAQFGLDPKTMPIKPLRVNQCVHEALTALSANRPLIIPGRLNRVMNKVLPASLTRKMMGKMFAQILAAERRSSRRETIPGSS